jgi:hypothetical protein
VTASMTTNAASTASTANTTRETVVYRNTDIRGVWRAMGCHASQLTWYRVLFVLLSQYSTLNRLSRVE